MRRGIYRLTAQADRGSRRGSDQQRTFRRSSGLGGSGMSPGSIRLLFAISRDRRAASEKKSPHKYKGERQMDDRSQQGQKDSTQTGQDNWQKQDQQRKPSQGQQPGQQGQQGQQGQHGQRDQEREKKPG